MLSDDETLELLRRAMAAAPSQPSGDLWPDVRRRIDAGRAAPAVSDWLILGVLALLCVLQPSLIGILLLHF